MEGISDIIIAIVIFVLIFGSTFRKKKNGQTEKSTWRRELKEAILSNGFQKDRSVSDNIVRSRPYGDTSAAEVRPMPQAGRIILGIILMALVVGGYYFVKFVNNQLQQEEDNSVVNVEPGDILNVGQSQNGQTGNIVILNESSSGAIVFTGYIKGINTECYVDGICSMNIGGVEVIFGQGWYAGPVGQLLNFGEWTGKEYIGREVEVYGIKEGDYVTILGSKDYYIRLLEIEN